MEKINAKLVTLGAITTAIVVGSFHGGVHALVEEMLHPAMAEASPLHESEATPFQAIVNHGGRSVIQGKIQQKTPIDSYPSTQVICNSGGARVIGDITQEITSVR